MTGTTFTHPCDASRLQVFFNCEIIKNETLANWYLGRNLPKRGKQLPPNSFYNVMSVSI